MTLTHEDIDAIAEAIWVRLQRPNEKVPEETSQTEISIKHKSRRTNVQSIPKPSSWVARDIWEVLATAKGEELQKILHDLALANHKSMNAVSIQPSRCRHWLAVEKARARLNPSVN